MNFPRILCILLSLACLATPLRGEDDGWLEFEEQPQVAQQNQFEVTPQQFEQWVFQHDGTAVAARKKLELELTLTIEEISRGCDLDAEQKQKLRLAGARDIRSFFSRFEALRKKYMAVSHNQQEFQKVWQEIQPLQVQLNAGLFNEKSMFKKVVNRTLSQSQDKRRRRGERERRNFRYRALVELYVMTLENSIPLSADQRDGLTKLILADTRPPNVFGQNNQIYLLYQLSQIDQKKLLAVVAGAPGKALFQTFQRGRGYERHLKGQGVVPFVEVPHAEVEQAEDASDPEGRAIDQAIEALINNPRQDQ